MYIVHNMYYFNNYLKTFCTTSCLTLIALHQGWAGIDGYNGTNGTDGLVGDDGKEVLIMLSMYMYV